MPEGGGSSDCHLCHIHDHAPASTLLRTHPLRASQSRSRNPSKSSTTTLQRNHHHHHHHHLDGGHHSRDNVSLRDADAKSMRVASALAKLSERSHSLPGSRGSSITRPNEVSILPNGSPPEHNPRGTDLHSLSRSQREYNNVLAALLDTRGGSLASSHSASHREPDLLNALPRTRNNSRASTLSRGQLHHSNLTLAQDTEQDYYTHINRSRFKDEARKQRFNIQTVMLIGCYTMLFVVAIIVGVVLCQQNGWLGFGHGSSDEVSGNLSNAPNSRDDGTSLDRSTRGRGNRGEWPGPTIDYDYPLESQPPRINSAGVFPGGQGRGTNLQKTPSSNDDPLRTVNFQPTGPFDGSNGNRRRPGQRTPSPVGGGNTRTGFGQDEGLGVRNGESQQSDGGNSLGSGKSIVDSRDEFPNNGFSGNGQNRGQTRNSNPFNNFASPGRTGVVQPDSSGRPGQRNFPSNTGREPNQNRAGINNNNNGGNNPIINQNGGTNQNHNGVNNRNFNDALGNGRNSGNNNGFPNSPGGTFAQPNGNQRNQPNRNFDSGVDNTRNSHNNNFNTETGLQDASLNGNFSPGGQGSRMRNSNDRSNFNGENFSGNSNTNGGNFNNGFGSDGRGHISDSTGSGGNGNLNGPLNSDGRRNNNGASSSNGRGNFETGNGGNTFNTRPTGTGNFDNGAGSGGAGNSGISSGGTNNFGSNGGSLGVGGNNFNMQPTGSGNFNTGGSSSGASNSDSSSGGISNFGNNGGSLGVEGNNFNRRPTGNGNFDNGASSGGVGNSDISSMGTSNFGINGGSMGVANSGTGSSTSGVGDFHSGSGVSGISNTNSGRSAGNGNFNSASGMRGAHFDNTGDHFLNNGMGGTSFASGNGGSTTFNNGGSSSMQGNSNSGSNSQVGSSINHGSAPNNFGNFNPGIDMAGVKNMNNPLGILGMTEFANGDGSGRQRLPANSDRENFNTGTGTGGSLGADLSNFNSDFGSNIGSGSSLGGRNNFNVGTSTTNQGGSVMNSGAGVGISTDNFNSGSAITRNLNRGSGITGSQSTTNGGSASGTAGNTHMDFGLGFNNNDHASMGSGNLGSSSFPGRANNNFDIPSDTFGEGRPPVSGTIPQGMRDLGNGDRRKMPSGRNLNLHNTNNGQSDIILSAGVNNSPGQDSKSLHPLNTGTSGQQQIRGEMKIPVSTQLNGDSPAHNWNGQKGTGNNGVTSSGSRQPANTFGTGSGSGLSLVVDGSQKSDQPTPEIPATTQRGIITNPPTSGKTTPLKVLKGFTVQRGEVVAISTIKSSDKDISILQPDHDVIFHITPNAPDAGISLIRHPNQDPNMMDAVAATSTIPPPRGGASPVLRRWEHTDNQGTLSRGLVREDGSFAFTNCRPPEICDTAHPGSMGS